jgi:putative DNA primase/helicase
MREHARLNPAGEAAEYMRSGACDDGMMQRFGLLVWPDHSPEWKQQDRYAETKPKTQAWQAFTRLDGLDWRPSGPR